MRTTEYNLYQAYTICGEEDARPFNIQTKPKSMISLTLNFIYCGKIHTEGVGNNEKNNKTINWQI